MCGEHAFFADMAQADAGSSPRVRGTRGRRERGLLRRGIIPACARNTARRRRSRACPWDHPRVCGEHLTIPRPSFPLMGSSPRVRGTHFNRAREGRVFGIIPACAGNTCRRWRRSAAPWDHPRVCGEHFAMYQLGGWLSGSSPRVRGTPVLVVRDFDALGIIPACAGNTLKNPSSKYHSD